jgi:hypothetical protein
MDRATDALHLRPILQIIPMHKRGRVGTVSESPPPQRRTGEKEMQSRAQVFRQPTETIAAAASLPESPGEAMRGEDG